MKIEQTKDSLILTEIPTLWRIVGIFLFAVAIAVFLFAYFGSIYYGEGMIFLTVILAIVSVSIGIVICFFGYTVISLPDRRIEINREKGKIFLNEKSFFKDSSEEFLIADVYKLEMITSELENSTLYSPMILFRGGGSIELPSDNQADKTKQTENLEKVREFLMIE